MRTVLVCVRTQVAAQTVDVYRAMAGEPHGSFPTFADGHRGMQVLEATLRSATDGGWVSVES